MAIKADMGYSGYGATALLYVLANQFDDKLKQSFEETFSDVESMLIDQFNQINESTSFESYLSTLIYSSLPCFDLKGLTSEVKGEKAFLQSCNWKGKSMVCSAIFKKILTDRGICCAFNKPEADALYAKSTYTNILKEVAEEEKRLSFDDSTIPDWFVENSEPKTAAGINMGLSVMLDTHTDLLAENSYASDYKGLTAIVLPKGDFPLSYLNEFQVKAGYVNFVSLSATKLKSNEDVKEIDPEKRNCYFADETQHVKLHTQYSQSNCLVECLLLNAQKLLQEKKNVTFCTPWFFPFLDSDHRMCNPWEKAEILETMKNNFLAEKCRQCLPDCNTVIYKKSFSIQKLKGCNSKNYGVSPFCGTRGIGIINQNLNAQNCERESKIINSGIRMIKPQIYDSFLFSNLTRCYSAFENDISVLNVFFGSPTALQYLTKHRETKFDYISDLGGNGGLLIGFSLVTAVEIFWLFLRISKNILFALISYLS